MPRCKKGCLSVFWIFLLLHIDSFRVQYLQNYGRCLLIPKYFCAVYDYAGKADLSKAYWNPKRKLGVTTHFSEKIKQQYL